MNTLLTPERIAGASERHFRSSAAPDVEAREEAHVIIRALNEIEVSLKADVDAVTILRNGRNSTVATTELINGNNLDAIAENLIMDAPTNSDEAPQEIVDMLLANNLKQWKRLPRIRMTSIHRPTMT